MKIVSVSIRGSFYTELISVDPLYVLFDPLDRDKPVAKPVLLTHTHTHKKKTAITAKDSSSE
jgi:hypothetical protein